MYPHNPVSELAELAPTRPESRAKRRWLVLYTRPRYEKKIRDHLAELSVDCFLPMREEVRQWSDRKKTVEVPLFSGYIFVHVNERERIRALETDGALKYVSFGGEIAVVSPHTIESLKIAVTRPDDIRIEDTSLELGQEVFVRHGPLSGMRGHLLEFRGGTRVAIRIEVINQIVSVEVPIADLDPGRHPSNV